MQSFIRHFSKFWLQIFRIILIGHCTDYYQWGFLSLTHQKIWHTDFEIRPTNFRNFRPAYFWGQNIKNSVT